MIPCPCRAVRSRSSRTCRSTTSAMEASKSTSMASSSPASSSSSCGRSGASPTQTSAVTGPQGPPDPIEQRRVGPVALDVGGRQSGDGSGAALGVVPQGDRRAIGKRAPQVRVDDHDLVSPAAQPELFHHQRVQQTDQVGARADAPPGLGKRLLERARPTNLFVAARAPGPSGPPGPGKRPLSGRCGRRPRRPRPRFGRPAPQSAPAGRWGRVRHRSSRPEVTE